MTKIDFHSHILPEMDDGARNADISLEMLKGEAAEGVSVVCATPHFYPTEESPEAFLRRRERSVGLLCEAARVVSGLPDIILGAEVYYFAGMSRSSVLPQLTLGGSRYILVEMPADSENDPAVAEVASINKKTGLIPIIAHVERCRYGNDTLEFLVSNRVIIQSNAEAFVSFWQRRQTLTRMSHDLIHIIGSDCHNITTRPPRIAAAYDLIGSKLGDRFLSAMLDFGEHITGDAERISLFQNEYSKNKSAV